MDCVNIKMSIIGMQKHQYNVSKFSEETWPHGDFVLAITSPVNESRATGSSSQVIGSSPKFLLSKV